MNKHPYYHEFVGGNHGIPDKCSVVWSFDGTNDPKPCGAHADDEWHTIEYDCPYCKDSGVVWQQSTRLFRNDTATPCSCHLGEEMREFL